VTKAVGQVLDKENDAIKEIIQRARQLLRAVAECINWLAAPKQQTMHLMFSITGRTYIKL
jgi:hypothetical protein